MCGYKGEGRLGANRHLRLLGRHDFELLFDGGCPDRAGITLALASFLALASGSPVLGGRVLGPVFARLRLSLVRTPQSCPRTSSGGRFVWEGRKLYSSIMERIPSKTRDNLRAALTIAAVAVATRLAIIFLAGFGGGPLYFAEVERVAKSLVTQHVFGNPYAVPTGPTAHLAPVYPWLVSLLFRLFGAGRLGALSVFLFNAVCASVQYALLVVLALACGLSPRVGILAGAVGALFPLHPLVEIDGWEASLVGMCWVAVLALTLYWWRRSPASGLRAVLAGLGWGLLILAAPQMLAVFAAVMILYFLVVPRSTLARTALALCAAALVLLPWVIRNQKTFGHLFFVRSNFGLELSMSNHDGVHPLLVQEMYADGDNTFHKRRHPALSVPEAQIVQRMGEVNYNHWRFEEASQWIRTHPSAFLRLTAHRFWYFWFGFHRYRTLILFPLVLAALLGLIRLFRVEPLAAWLFAACWAMFPLVYYFVCFDSRYAYPMNQTFLFLASFLLIDTLKLGIRPAPLRSPSSLPIDDRLPQRSRTDPSRPLSVVIPAYNEEATLTDVVDRVLAVPSVREIVIVDDCSRDQTGLIADRLALQHSEIKVAHHAQNRGKTEALKTAFALTEGDIVIVQDADLEYDPGEIEEVIAPILTGLADVVYGSRFLVRKAARVVYFYHYLGNCGLTFLSNLFTNVNMTDVETGYKAFRGDIIRNMIITSSGFGFEIEVTAKIAKLKCPIYEVPISYHGRTYEEGKKIGFADGLAAAWYILNFNLFCGLKRSFKRTPGELLTKIRAAEEVHSREQR